MVKKLFKHKTALTLGLVLSLLASAFFTTQPVSACGITEGFAADTNTGQMLCSFIEPANQLQQDLRGWVFNKSQESFLISGGPINEISTSAWANILVVANVLLAMAFLVVIYGFATDSGSVRIGYLAKKILPRLIIGAIAINVSFYAILAIVDLSSIIGSGLNRLIIGRGDSTIAVSTLTNKTDCENHELAWRNGRCFMDTNNAPPNPAIEGAALTLVVPSNNADQRIQKFLSNGDNAAAVEMNSHSLAIGWLLAVALAIVNLSYIGLLMLFTFRQIVVIVLAVVSSVAFCSIVLSGTKKFFWSWLDFLIRVILIAPVYTLAQTFAFFVVDAIPSGQNQGVGIVEIIAEATVALLILAVCVLCFVKSKGIIQKTGKLLSSIREQVVSRGVVKETSKSQETTNRKNQLAEENKTRSNVFKLDEKATKTSSVATQVGKHLRSRHRIGGFNIDQATLNIKNSTIAQSSAKVDGAKVGNAYSDNGRIYGGDTNNNNDSTSGLISNQLNATTNVADLSRSVRNNLTTNNIDERSISRGLDKTELNGELPSIVNNQNKNTFSRSRQANVSKNNLMAGDKIRNTVSNQNTTFNSTKNRYEKTEGIKQPSQPSSDVSKVNNAREKYDVLFSRDSKKDDQKTVDNKNLEDNIIRNLAINPGEIESDNLVEDSAITPEQKRDQREVNAAISPNQLSQQIREKYDEPN